MSDGFLLFVLIGLALLVIVLSVAIVRLRLELWANRRVLAAFEGSGPKPVKAASKSSLPALLAWIILLMVVTQLLGNWFGF
jgi:uncharacterized membrane protein